ESGVRGQESGVSEKDGASGGPRSNGSQKSSLQSPNSPAGVAISYYLRHAAKEPVTLTVFDSAGKQLAVLPGLKTARFPSVVWDCRSKNGNGNGSDSAAGPYNVQLKVGGDSVSREMKVSAVD